MPKHSIRRRTKHAHLLPSADFPLSPHVPTGRWYKTYEGKRYYVGALNDPDAALKRWVDIKHDIDAGRSPRARTDGLVLRDLCNGFLDAKMRRVEAGELKPGTFAEYHRACGRIIEAFGPRRAPDDLLAQDFAEFRARLAKHLGPCELGKMIQLTRSLFKHAYESGFIDKPPRYGPEFTRPSRKVLRRVRKGKPPRFFEAGQIRRILKAASVPLRAMALLGINCGYGQTDCAELPQDVIDFDAGILDWPRPKTEIDRRCALWPETIEALQVAIEARPRPKARADADAVFLTKYGHRWVRFRPGQGDRRGAAVDSVNLQFGKLLTDLGLKRPGLGFYALRHTHRTISDEVGDRAACDLIMGHEPPGDMAVAYRERIDDSRLQAVTEHVHRWLYSG